MLFLDRIGLQKRFLLSATNLSLPPLLTRNAPRLGAANDWLQACLTTTNQGDGRFSRHS